jgi:hypothetical protein
MSVRELKRVEVSGRVNAGEVTLRQPGELLAISYRQAKRLWQRYFPNYYDPRWVGAGEHSAVLAMAARSGRRTAALGKSRGAPIRPSLCAWMQNWDSDPQSAPIDRAVKGRPATFRGSGEAARCAGAR